MRYVIRLELEDDDQERREILEEVATMKKSLLHRLGRYIRGIKT